MITKTKMVKSRIGYGCSSLMGRIGLAESLRLLEESFDSGIRHYDVAPAYGLGSAEIALGKFAKGKREEISITTKIGLMPVIPTGMLELAKSAFRGICASNKLAYRLASQVRRYLIKKEKIDASYIRRCLHQSLLNLQTDYVDIYLLHEAGVGDLTQGESIFELDRLVKEGLIRTYGFGSNQDRVNKILQLRRKVVPVVQVESSLGNWIVPDIDAIMPQMVITHGTYGTMFHRFVESLGNSPIHQQMFLSELGVNPKSKSEIAKLFMRYSLSRNRSGAVLFSAVDKNHIHSNAKLQWAPLLTDSECGVLEKMMSKLRQF